MDEKQLQAIKAAKKKMVDGSLTIWNARLDALHDAGLSQEVINHIGSPADSAWTDICGCPGPGSPKCGCGLDNPIDFDTRINEMNQKINAIQQDIKKIKG